MADLEEGSAQIPKVVGQPVNQHCEGEIDAREDVHDREDEGHHLLHLVLLSLHGRPGHVPPDVVELRVEHGQAHEHDEDHYDYAARTLGGHEVVRNPQPEKGGLFEFPRHLSIEGSQRCPLATGDEGHSRKHVEHGHEDRALDQRGQTGTHGVGMVILVDLHGLPAHGLSAGWILLVAVLVLDLHQLGLQGLHLLHGSQLLDEERQDAKVDDQHQHHYRERPCHSGSLVEPDQGQKLVAVGHDVGHEPLDRVQDLVEEAVYARIESESVVVLEHCQAVSLSGAMGVSRASSWALDHENR